MRIGIEAERANIDFPTGVEHYAQQIVLSLAEIDRSNTYVLYLRSQPKKWIRELPENFHTRSCRSRSSGPSCGFPGRCCCTPVDALFIPASALPLLHPRNSVVTIHDLAWKYYPETFSRGMRWFLRLSTWFAVHSAATVIAVSEQTKADLISEYGLAPERVAVVYHGFLDGHEGPVAHGTAEAAAAEAEKIAALPQPLILYLGTLQPRKNILRLIDAFLEMKQRSGLPHVLVLAGGKGWLYDQIMEKIDRHPEVIYFGYVQDRFALLRRAEMLVQPALYEGFGLTVLDAFAAGVPVACSQVSSLPEVAGMAAEYFDPADTMEMSMAIQRVAEDAQLRIRLVEAGKQQLQKFSWKDCAEQTLKVFHGAHEPLVPIGFRARAFRNQTFWLAVTAIAQFAISGLVAVGIIPQAAAYAAFAIQGIAIVCFDIEYALYSVILALPWFLAVPNPRFDTLSLWRPAVALLAAVAVLKSLPWKQGMAAVKSRIGGFVRSRLLTWDIGAIVLVAVLLFSIAFAAFKGIGLKEILFLVNAWLLYLVAEIAIATKGQLKRLAAAVAVSLFAVVAIGYVQYIATFTAQIYYFWQYWATVIARPFYGSALSDSLTYSNSWFNFAANTPPTLRMFSILPDSHAFGVIAMFAAPLAYAFAIAGDGVWKRLLAWAALVLELLAVILSGTRGIWAAVIAPIAVLAAGFWFGPYRRVARRAAGPTAAFLILLALSPLIQHGLNDLRNGAAGSFIQRAESIYDLSESSNHGRILIWEQSLRAAERRPIAGYGLDNFIVTLTSAEQGGSYQDAANQHNATFNLPQKYVTAHNLYLQVLVEAGIIGLAGLGYYLWTLLCVFGGAIKKYAVRLRTLEYALLLSISLAVLQFYAYLFLT